MDLIFVLVLGLLALVFTVLAKPSTGESEEDPERLARREAWKRGFQAPIFLKLGVVVAITGLVMMNIGVYQSKWANPLGGIPWYFGVGCGLGQVGFAGIAHWVAARHERYGARIRSILLFVLPFAVIALASSLWLKLGGAKKVDEAFVYQALSGTPFAMHRMVFTGVAMILPMQMLTESYLRWRKLI